MIKRSVGSVLVVLAAVAWAAESEPDDPSPDVAGATSVATLSEGDATVSADFFVVPIHDQIGKPTVFIVRTGVKEAVAANAGYVVLDMDTPGGDLGSTLEIMEILDRFEGRVITYVNREAGSAGAIIAGVTDEIYFEPKAVIGAAEPIMATGEDVSEGLKRKMTAYLSAKIEALAEGRKYRGEVLRAMMDPVYELTIDGQTLKEKDELLMLTAEKAMRPFGDPPQPLLGSGIYDDLDSLLRHLAGGPSFTVKRFQMTWSVELAQWLMKLSPILLGIGGLLLFIEFKTPGFGIFGVAGILVLLIVFFGHNIAGLSGHEPVLVFLLGVALVFVELFFFPGMLVFAISGLALMAGSLLWGMADIWPGSAFELSPEVFIQPAYNLALGFILAVVLIVAAARFLPKSLFWNRLVLAAEVSGSATRTTPAEVAVSAGASAGPGMTGVVAVDLHPVGRVEIEGRQYEARVEVGELVAGTRVRVVRRADFVLIVEPVES